MKTISKLSFLMFMLMQLIASQAAPIVTKVAAGSSHRCFCVDGSLWGIAERFRAVG